MPQCKLTKKMADFLNILSWSPEDLICFKTYQTFQGEEKGSCPWSLRWRHRSSGFYCNRLEIKNFKKCLKMLIIFLYTFSSLQTSCIDCSLLNFPGQRVVSRSHGTKDVPRTKPFWKMANFLREHSQGTYYDILVIT